MKKVLFISTLILVFIFLFLLYIFLTNLRSAPQEEIREIPVPTESQIKPTVPFPPLVEDQPLIEQIIQRLPASTTEYDIEYLSSSNTFVITIKDSPFEQNSQKALQWFFDNGIKNPEGLNIIYNSYEWVE